MKPTAFRSLVSQAHVLSSLSLATVALAAAANDSFQPGYRHTADIYNSGFSAAHDDYNGLGFASDGRLYYVLNSEQYDVGAQMFALDPVTKKIQHIGDLTEACGYKGTQTVVQGKCHVNFVESNGKLYFATHAGYYKLIDKMEKIAPPPPGWKPYPGGHLLAYDLKNGKFENLGLVLPNQGVITFDMDAKRGRIFGITWPSGTFFRFDVATKNLKTFGKMCGDGEDTSGPNYRTVCRSITVNPDDGSAWFTNAEGAILRYRADKDTVAPIAGDNFRKDYFGQFDPAEKGGMGYNWRQSIWHPGEHAIYAVHGRSGYVVRIDPIAEQVQVLERLTSGPSKASGMFDNGPYGYLGFRLGPDGHTLYYLTGGPIYRDGKRLKPSKAAVLGESSGGEDLHLVTYDTNTGQCRDHGSIYYENGDCPVRCNSIAIAGNGTIYFSARVLESGKSRIDLASVADPMKR